MYGLFLELFVCAFRSLAVSFLLCLGFVSIFYCVIFCFKLIDICFAVAVDGFLWQNYYTFYWCFKKNKTMNCFSLSLFLSVCFLCTFNSLVNRKKLCYVLYLCFVVFVFFLYFFFRLQRPSFVLVLYAFLANLLR